MSLLQLTRRLTVSEPNVYHFVMDIAWFGLALATTSRFLSVYAIHLGATATHLTWMTSLPALMLLVSSMFSGWWRSRYEDSHHAVLLPSIGFRLNFFFLALTPFLPNHWQPIWLVISLTLSAIPQGISGVLFLGLMRESITTETWTRLTSWRHMAMNTSIAVGAIVAGIWLEQMPFPMNYQIMFFVAFIATLFSLWHVMRVKPIFNIPSERPNIFKRKIWQSAHLKHLLWVVMLTHIPFFIVYPLVPLQLIETFQVEESFIAVFGLAELVGGIFIAGFATRWFKQWGQQRVMSSAMMLTGVGVAIIALAPHVFLTIPAAFLLGGSWTLVGIGIMALIGESIPPEKILAHNMIFTQFVGLATFIGPLFGNFMIAQGQNLVMVLLIGATIRILAGWALQFKKDSSIELLQ